MVNIAILGLGTIGYGVYDIITKNFDNIKVKRVFDKDFSKQDLVNNIITDDFNEIINDDEISIVVETLGGLEFPYSLIKKAIENKKHVVTANKEVMARYFNELMILKDKYKVSLSFEASVGGGVPIIKNLIDIQATNEVYSINGIINGTTNFILTKLSQGYDFDSALKIAQEKGFAEADSSYDLDGLDMLRKISILANIASKKLVNIDNVYHYSMKDVCLDDINFVKRFGFSIKYVASFSNKFIGVEPTLVKGMFSLVNDEYNIINVEASNYGNLVFYGKGAGRYATANAIVNDINDIVNGNKNYMFKANGNFEVEEDDKEYVVYLRLKDVNKFEEKYIFKKENNLVLTKNMKRSEIDFDNVLFYAKAK